LLSGEEPEFGRESEGKAARASAPEGRRGGYPASSHRRDEFEEGRDGYGDFENGLSTGDLDAKPSAATRGGVSGDRHDPT
jgi:hypothetical protein